MSFSAQSRVRPSGGKRAISFRRRILFLSLVLIALAAVLELGTRGYNRLRTGRWTVGDPERAAVNAGLYTSNVWTGQIPRPGAVVEFPGRSIHINSLGFRGYEISPHKSAGTVRIACLGGSTTFDVKVSDDTRTWPAQMEAVLRARHGIRNVEVINAATCGYSLQRSLIDLTTRVLDVRPDWIICYAGVNDLAAAHRPDHQVGQSHLATVTPQETPWYRRLMGTSEFCNEVVSRLRYARQLKYGNWEGRPIERTDEPDPRGIAAFGRNLKTLVGICRAHDIRLALVTVRTAYAPMQPMDVQMELARMDLMDHSNLSLQGHYRGYAMINQVIREVGRAYQVPVIDQAMALPAGDMHFADSVHFNDAGAAALAMLAADELAPHLKPDTLPGEPIVVSPTIAE